MAGLDRDAFLEPGGKGVGLVAAFGQKLGSDWPEQTVNRRWTDSIELGERLSELGMAEQPLAVEADGVSKEEKWASGRLPGWFSPCRIGRNGPW
ncbi:MAG: hypothetical protein ABIL25_10760 [candidate division WOR-3 bacterium]